MAQVNSPSPQPRRQSQPTDRNLGLLVAGIGLLGFGGMMALMMLAFARDLSALRDAPAELWSALCGQPVQSDLTLPILLAASIAGVLAGAALLIAARFRSRRRV